MTSRTAKAASEGAVFRVAVDAPVPDVYSYLAPPGVELRAGQMVRVPLRGGQRLGYVLAREPEGVERAYKLKPVAEVVVAESLFGEDLVKLVEFVSSYYLYPPGLCVKEILPGGLRPKLVKEAVLTSAGKEAAEAKGEAAPELLKELLGIWPEPLSGAKLAKLARDLGRLASQGLVRPSWRLDERGVGLRYEMWLSAVPRAALEGVRLGPKEKELYALLEGAPPTPLSHYRAIMPDPLAQAKSLARKGLVAIESRERFRDDPGRALSVDHQKVESLTAEQEAAMAAIGPALAEGGNHAFLLFGVTGSGKTEIYLRAAELALSAGKGVLWLAPEIALTMGLEGRLKSRFPALPISVLHSGLTPGQRHDHWMALRRGRSRLALGARSAVFAPVAGLGLVVVDEEHDWAYKQDDGLRYNGRDLAAWRAREAGSALILGSATPSLESYHGALTGRLRLLRMESRPGASVMPEVIIVDRRGESGRSPLAAEVRASMREAFGRGEQALMFINRRGMANVPKCLSCGEALKCPHCDLSLTLHGRGADPRALREDEAGEPALHAPLGPEHRLVCHGCGYRAWPPKRCPNCQSELVRYMGIGTQSLAKLVEKDFGKKGLRLDTDSAKAKGGLKGILESFAKGEADFLVGTQMAAKGHDFSHLTMVGVVDADLGLNWPDFRAAERTFQLLSQVSGRAGRREAPGKVYIQTRNPGHYSMVAARDHDYELFFQKEIAIRQELGYPPFARLALIRLSGPDEGAVSEAAERAAEAGRAIIGGAPPEEVEIFGPAPAHVAKLRERYRYQIMLRSRTAYERHRVLLAWTPGVRKGLPEEVIMTVDVDPYDLP